MNRINKELILAFAQNNMNVSKTSRQVFMHRNTVTYRFEKIKEETGLDPLTFYDLVELVGME